MRRALIGLALALLGVVALAVLVLPSETVDFTPRLAEVEIADPEAWIERREGVFDDIRPGAEKRILRIAPRTDWVVVYLHGFSASAQETRPLARQVAAKLGANLFETRLAGHGRDGVAMAEAEEADWVFDFNEAMAIARGLGDRVLVIGVSTGATLATSAFAEGREADAFVAISPNYRIANPAAVLLTWPGARHWLPPLFGRERAFAPLNDAHAAAWTARYPTVALMPMAALVAHARDADHARIEVPALFVFDPGDRVVSHEATRAVAAAWGGPVHVEEVETGADDDPQRHVIAGDILSPGMTADVAARIIDWVEGL